MPTPAIPHFRAEILALMTKLFLVGAGFATYLILFVFCLRFILFDIHGWSTSRILLFAFICLSLICVMIDFMGEYTGDTVLILCSLDSDSPLTHCDNFQFDKPAFRREVAFTVAEGILFILADGMLYYRAVIIWQRDRWIVSIGGFLLVASEALQIYTQIVAFDVRSHRTLLAVSFWLASAYDIASSALIIGRLIYYRRNAKMAQRDDSIAIYTSLVTVFFEASLLFSSARILYASMLVSNKKYLYNFWPRIVNDIAAAISPLFIILRLALNSFKDPYQIRRGDDPAKRQKDIESTVVFARGSPRSTSSRSGVLRSILLGTTSTTRSGNQHHRTNGGDGLSMVEETDSQSQSQSENEKEREREREKEKNGAENVRDGVHIASLN